MRSLGSAFIGGFRDLNHTCCLPGVSPSSAHLPFQHCFCTEPGERWGPAPECSERLSGLASPGNQPSCSRGPVNRHTLRACGQAGCARAWELGICPSRHGSGYGGVSRGISKTQPWGPLPTALRRIHATAAPCCKSLAPPAPSPRGLWLGSPPWDAACDPQLLSHQEVPEFSGLLGQQAPLAAGVGPTPACSALCVLVPGTYQCVARGCDREGPAP